MAKPYSVDLRERLVASVEKGGLSRREAASRFGVGISTAIIWVRRFRQTGSVAPGQMGGHKPKAIRGEHHAWLVERIRGKAFTLRGLVAELAARGLKVDYHSVWNFVHAEKLSFKKTVLASEQDRPDVARTPLACQAHCCASCLAMRRPHPRRTRASAALDGPVPDYTRASFGPCIGT